MNGFLRESNILKPKRIRTISFISKRTNISANENDFICLSNKNINYNWNIQFSDSKNMDAYKFIDLVSEQKKMHRITDEELLNMIPNLLAGHALKWYHKYQKKFVTWQDFVVNFTQDYKDSKHLPCLINKKKRTRKNNKKDK